MPKFNPNPGQVRVPLSLKVSQDFRAMIEEAATESGRSLTAEVEYRVRQTFNWDQQEKKRRIERYGV